MKTIKQITEELIKQRDIVNKISDTLKEAKVKKDAIQQLVLEELNAQGFKSIKTETATVSKATKKTLKIVNESALIEDLKSKGLNDYVKEQVDKNLFKGLSTKLVKEDNLMEGTEVSETEYISIRSIK